MFNFFVIKITILGSAIRNKIVDFGGPSDWRTMSEMATVAKIHGKNFITRLAPGEIYGFVSIGSWVGLDIGVISMKKLHGPFNGETLNAVNISLPTVIAVIW